MSTYAIIRMYRDSSKRDHVFTGLTLEEAREHCQDDQTSSSTCTNDVGLARTEMYGPWFDGYEEENQPRRKQSMMEQLAELQTI